MINSKDQKVSLSQEDLRAYAELIKNMDDKLLAPTVKLTFSDVINSKAKSNFESLYKNALRILKALIPTKFKILLKSKIKFLNRR